MSHGLIWCKYGIDAYFQSFVVMKNKSCIFQKYITEIATFAVYIFVFYKLIRISKIKHISEMHLHFWKEYKILQRFSATCMQGF